MATTKISVSIKGPVGLDDPDRLLRELEAETGLSWRQEPVAEEKTLSGGLFEIVLVALVTGASSEAGKDAWNAAKQVVKRWRSEKLDPTETSVEIESLPDADVAEPSVSDGLDD